MKKPSDETLVAWAQGDELNELGKYLLSGMVHGKPGIPVAELSRVEKVFCRSFTEAEQYHLGKKLLKRPEYTARNLSCSLIPKGWPKKKDVLELLRQAANDGEWIVREYAAGGLSQLLAKDFPHFSKLFQTWIQEESVNVKRAIALAVKFDSKKAVPEKWITYFNLIDPLMCEEAEYIRKNLGPFAIGDGLLSRYPDQILKSCKEWSKSKNKNTRWNTAMIFTAASARKYKKEGLEVLKILIKDPEPFVSRAAIKAQRNLDLRS